MRTFKHASMQTDRQADRPERKTDRRIDSQSRVCVYVFGCSTYISHSLFFHECRCTIAIHAYRRSRMYYFWMCFYKKSARCYGRSGISSRLAARKCGPDAGEVVIYTCKSPGALKSTWVRPYADYGSGFAGSAALGMRLSAFGGSAFIAVVLWSDIFLPGS